MKYFSGSTNMLVNSFAHKYSVFSLFFFFFISNTLLANEFFPVVQEQGRTEATIHPIESVHPNKKMLISFGVPFPKGYMTDLGKLRVLNAAGEELAIFTKVLTPWRYLGTLTTGPSIRAAIVQVNLSFPDTDNDGKGDSISLIIEWGQNSRTFPLLAERPARENWQLVNSQMYPELENIYEPPAFATFTPEWYGKSVIKTRLYAEGEHKGFSGYEQLFKLFSNTSLNKVDPRVSIEYLNEYLSKYSSWLFDRPMTLYQLALKTGNVEILREAHRASQFYSQHINENGYFDLKPTNDLKYSSIEGLAANYWLTGDSNQLAIIERMIPGFKSFNMTYTLDSNFWTERHAAFSLAGFVVSFELFGDSDTGQLAIDAFSTLLSMQNTPLGEVDVTGALFHTGNSHGGGGEQLISSPWMSALLIDSVERYYIHSNDQRVKTFVYKMADYMEKEGIYYTADFNKDFLPASAVPFYIAGQGLSDQQRNFDPWSNIEHAPDVSKIFALAYFFSRIDNTPSLIYLNNFSELFKTSMELAFPRWVRPAAPSAILGTYQGGKSVFRTSPTRKFNWWFRTTTNLDWLIGKDTPLISKQDVNNEYIDNAVIEVTISADKTQAVEGDIITFTLLYENTGQVDAKGVSLRGFIDTNLDYFEFVSGSVSNSGIAYLNEIFWPIGSIEAQSGEKSVSFQVKVIKPEFTFTHNRPSPAIVVRAQARYGNITDEASDLIPATNFWDVGTYSHSRASSIAVVTTNESFANKDTIAVDQFIEAFEDIVLNINLQGYDPEGDIIKFEILTPPISGNLSGTIPHLIYTPNKDFNGSDSFEYIVMDQIDGLDRGIVTLDVKAVNDRPVASNSTVIAENGVAVNIVLQGQDVDSSSISFVHTLPAHGVLTGENGHLVYTANTPYQGEDSFSFYVVDDNAEQSDEAEVRITVIPFNNAPIAENQALLLSEDDTVDITLNATDIDSTILTYNIATQPLHGELIGAAPNLSYIPHANFVGEDSFSFLVSDGHKTSEEGFITLNVTNENDGPEAKDIYVETYMASSVEIDLTAIDPDLDSLLYEIISLPGSGGVSGDFPVVTYQPDGMVVGQVQFTYQVFDGQSYSQANVYIEIKVGSEFSLYIESAIEQGKLNSWVGQQVIAKLDLYQKQLSVIKALEEISNTPKEKLIEAQHDANMIIYSSHFILAYATKNEVYNYIDENISKLLFNTLSSGDSSFEEAIDFLYEQMKAGNGHGYPIGGAIKLISVSDYYYSKSLLNENDPNLYKGKAKAELDKLTSFISPYVLAEPTNEVYRYIQTTIVEKLVNVVNETTANVDLKNYLETVITENNLPSWIGNYVLGRLSLYQDQLVVIEELNADPNVSIINNILARYTANMYIIESYSYLNYASRNQYYDYIDTEITNLLLNTLSSNEPAFKVAQGFAYTQLRERNGHSWPLGSAIKYIITLDYHYSQLIANNDESEEHLLLATATLQQAITFIDSYIASDPDNEAYKIIREIFDVTLREKIY
ncbi:MAG: putative repeat protein (TIGR01451 family) [Alteromonadaceae bacterium]|jgi:uncharacterized repeat protein (TIGR01451 family)